MKNSFQYVRKYIVSKCSFFEYELVFLLTGDDGKALTTSSNTVTKESEHLYTLWCSGRTCCEGMLVELKFLNVST